MSCRPSYTLRWKMPLNRVDAGGPPTQLDNATVERVAQAFAVSQDDYSRMQNMEQAARVKIIEKVFMKTEKWATPTNVLLDSDEAVKRCKAPCCTA